MASEYIMIQKRLDNYFKEADKHIELIKEALEVLLLKIPIESYKNLNQLEKFALNSLIFRFSKLQDLIGVKIFRSYLEYNEFNTTEATFFDILKEIEKEGIVDIDTWQQLREIRNKIAHDYPDEEDEINESINIFLEKSGVLLDISKNLKEKYIEIKRKRG